MANFGVHPSPPDDRDYPAGVLPSRATALPSELRLDGAIKIRNQGFCGTCVGKSVAAALSALFGVDLSALFVYAKCKEIDGIPLLQGTYPRTAMKIVQKYGVCKDKTLPYSDLKSCMVFPLIKAFMEEEAQQYGVKRYARLHTVHEIKEALAAGHAVVICTIVYDNFMNYRGKGSIGRGAGASYGPHLSGLCGYSDHRESLRGFNSWGEENWGEEGFYWLEYDVLSSPLDFIEAWGMEIEIEEKPKFEWDHFLELLKKLLEELMRLFPRR